MRGHAIQVDPERLRLEHLPCHWCGDEIDYNAPYGANNAYIVYLDRPSHFVCAMNQENR